MPRQTLMPLCFAATRCRRQLLPPLRHFRAAYAIDYCFTLLMPPFRHDDAIRHADVDTPMSAAMLLPPLMPLPPHMHDTP